MTEKELAEEINKWFNKINPNTKNFWNAHPVAKAIKANINKLGNFKGKPRGKHGNQTSKVPIKQSLNDIIKKYSEELPDF